MTSQVQFWCFQRVRRFSGRPFKRRLSRRSLDVTAAAPHRQSDWCRRRWCDVITWCYPAAAVGCQWQHGSHRRWRRLAGPQAAITHLRLCFVTNLRIYCIKFFTSHIKRRVFGCSREQLCRLKSDLERESSKRQQLYVSLVPRHIANQIRQGHVPDQGALPCLYVNYVYF